MRFTAAFLLTLFSGSAFFQAAGAELAAPAEQLLISVPDQKMRLVRNGEKVADFPISTSKFGEGDFFNSYRTPLGHFVISRKVGEGLPAGAVLKRLQPTGEVLAVNARGRDPIVTRVFCLEGRESSNRNARARRIYIHGTPEEKRLGRKASFGCIRMGSRDAIQLYRFVQPGTPVSVQNLPLRQMARSARDPRIDSGPLLAGARLKQD